MERSRCCRPKYFMANLWKDYIASRSNFVMSLLDAVSHPWQTVAIWRCCQLMTSWKKIKWRGRSSWNHHHEPPQWVGISLRTKNIQSHTHWRVLTQHFPYIDKKYFPSFFFAVTYLVLWKRVVFSQNRRFGRRHPLLMKFFYFSAKNIFVISSIGHLSKLLFYILYKSYIWPFFMCLSYRVIFLFPYKELLVHNSFGGKNQDNFVFTLVAIYVHFFIPYFKLNQEEIYLSKYSFFWLLIFCLYKLMSHFLLKSLKICKDRGVMAFVFVLLK